MNTTIAPQTKLSAVLSYLDAGLPHEALRIAARFPQLGAERAAILDAHVAITNPRFCRQLGKDPEALIAVGVAALRSKYLMR